MLLNSFVCALKNVYYKPFERQLKKNGNFKIAKSAKIDCYRNIRCNSGTITISDNTYINALCMLSTKDSKIEIGKNVMIGPGTIINTAHHNFEKIDVAINLQNRSDKPIIIEDDVWIGANCTILGGTRIGAHSIIGAHSLVNKEIPSYSIAYGIPCKVKKNRKT